MKRFIIDDNSKYYPNQYQLSVINAVNGFYQSQRFYILPYLPDKFYNRVTFIPYIPQYMKNIEKYSKYSCHDDLPHEISSVIIKELEDYRDSKKVKFQGFLNKLESLDEKFIYLIEEITKKRIKIPIKICPKLCGTLSSYNKDIDGVLEVYPRFDITQADIYKIILHAVIHHMFFNDISEVGKEELNQISTKTFEISKNPLLKDYLTESKTMPEILQENSCARLIEDSIKYCKKLGYPIVPYIKNSTEIKNLTNEEEELLHLLIKNKRKIVTFEDIGTTIWGQEANEKYSLYAISKIVERTRKKLIENDLAENLIHTQRGMGYVLYD